MSSLISRGAVLTASRLSNFGILLLSPLILVRILDVDSYGQYREFMIYAMIFISFCSFAFDSCLTYFIPKFPDREIAFVSQSSVLILIISASVLALLFLLRPYFQAITNYDFTVPLAAYVFCFVNLNWLEYYWIAKRRTDLVLYYSAIRLLVRIGTLVLVAYLTRDLTLIIWSIVGVEAVRLLIVAACLLRVRMFTFHWRASELKEQIRFASPIGLARVVQHASRDIGKLFIGSLLGPAALAYYAVGGYLLPFVRMTRSSIADVVFPELVRTRHRPEGMVRLWQRSNVMYCVLLFPAFVVFWHYAELIVETLFTKAYLVAVPIFQVHLLYLLRRCFNMDVLLRTRGKTGFVLTGTVLSLALNTVLMVLFYRLLGFIGPAVAFVVSEVLLEIYYGSRLMREMKLSPAQLVDWAGVWKVSAGCLAGLPALLLADMLPGPELLRASLSGLAFVAICWGVAFRLGVADIGRLVSFALTRLHLIRK